MKRLNLIKDRSSCRSVNVESFNSTLNKILNTDHAKKSLNNRIKSVVTGKKEHLIPEKRKAYYMLLKAFRRKARKVVEKKCADAPNKNECIRKKRKRLLRGAICKASIAHKLFRKSFPLRK